MKLRRRRRVKAFPQKRSQLGGSGLLPGIWVQGFARSVHLAGQRLRRRPDKCDAGRRPSGRRSPRPAASGRTCAHCRSSSSHRNRFAVVRADDEALVPPQAAGLALTVARPLPTETASLGFGGSPVGGGDKNSRFAFFRHFCAGEVSLSSGRCSCVRITPRGVYFSRKNGFLRVGALHRRARCSLLHTALFRRSSMGVVSLPSACASCCRNAGRPQVTAAYSSFLCRRSARPVWAEDPRGGHTRHPSPEPHTQRLTRRNTAGSQGRW